MRSLNTAKLAYPAIFGGFCCILALSCAAIGALTGWHWSVIGSCALVSVVSFLITNANDRRDPALSSSAERKAVKLITGTFSVLFGLFIIYLSVTNSEGMEEPLRNNQPLAIGLGGVFIVAGVVAAWYGIKGKRKVSSSTTTR